MFVEHKEQGEVTLDPARQLILKAANAIEKFGHAKKSLGSEREGFCINGALNYSETGKSDEQGPNRCGAAMILGVHLGDELRWNNAPERTKAEVVAKLRAVALGAVNRGFSFDRTP